MSTFTPDTTTLAQREIQLRILTQAGWVEGTIALRPKTRVSEYFDRQHEFVSLSDVKLEGKLDRFPSLTLRRSSILLILGGHDPAPASDGPPAVEHEVECLLAQGFVSGRLPVVKSVRVSDYLALHSETFAVLRDARIRLRDPWSNEGIDLREPAAILNMQAIVGIKETEAQPRRG